MKITAKKSYGQHFLINENIASDIVDEAVSLAQNLPILEIGPGKGVLTKYLLEKNILFHAVEADQDMVDYLYKNFENIETHLITADFLKFDFDTVFEGSEFLLFGNFPYNISSQILIRMIDNKKRIPYMVGMFQKEVAERITASKGNKSYGILSVLTQAYYTGKIIFRLSPGSFAPPPKVDSAVIRLERKPDFDLKCNENLFRTIVKVTFNQRRKMLRNTLKSLIPEAEILREEFFNLRPEQLSVDDFVYLTNIIEQHKNK